MQIKGPNQVSEHRASVMTDRYKLCPQCGNFSHINEGQEYCMVCGTKFLASCPGCNEPILHPIAVYCPSCGQKLVKKKNSK